MTTLEIHNASDKPVLTYLTLGATPGCVQDVSTLVFSPAVVLNVLAPLMGSFTLTGGETVQIVAPETLGLNGNFSFGTPPLNCPCPDWPEGVALAEFIINNGFQPGGQETVDISCVCGANAYLSFDLDAGDWTSNGGEVHVQQIKNSTRYKNTGLLGVFPYGCDNCTSSDAPPECVGKHPHFANKDPICNVQRSAASNQGGTVRVNFLGWTPVPLVAREKYDLVRNALTGLVKASTAEELLGMESAIALMAVPEAEKSDMINAVRALRATL